MYVKPGYFQWSELLPISLMIFFSVLQQAGRNPSQKALDKYWPPGTKKLNFDDFCEMVRKENPAESDELMRIFKKFDINCDGCISHDELSKVLTSVSIYSVKEFNQK